MLDFYVFNLAILALWGLFFAVAIIGPVYGYFLWLEHRAAVRRRIARLGRWAA